MVNKLQTFRPQVVEAHGPLADDLRATAKGGLVAVQALANRLRLWSDMERLVPGRKDPTQGYSVVGVLCALIHGLLSGGRGFQATEPLRGDTPLLRLLGLSSAPSAETVEEVIKHLEKVGGTVAINGLLRRFSQRILLRMGRRELLAAGNGFLTFWLDGSHLEVEGKNFDSVKKIKGKRGQLCVGGYVGPCLAAMDFALEDIGEETVTRRFIGEVYREVIRPLGMEKDTLVLLDSLYGDGPIFDVLESLPGKPAFIVGVQKLETAHKVMAELPEVAWREMGPNPQRGWAKSAWAQAWVECKGWKRKRPMICHRWVNEGEFIVNYAAVVTWLIPGDKRVAALMNRWKLPFEETMWALYCSKQGLENYWKETLEDMGLHHPPCAKAAVNAVFYAAAALAYNLAVGVRYLGFAKAENQTMRLWRFRREVIDLVAVAAAHAGRIIARMTDARDHLIQQLQTVMHRLARC